MDAIRQFGWSKTSRSRESFSSTPSPSFPVTGLTLTPSITCRLDDEHRFRALKVLSAECYGQDSPIFEREILTHLRSGNRKLLGYKYVCQLVDDFELKGPNGDHVCLVLELMGENLRTFGVWFHEDMVPTPIMRKFTFQLVCALDFAHESGVIHTGTSLP